MKVPQSNRALARSLFDRGIQSPLYLKKILPHPLFNSEALSEEAATRSKPRAQISKWSTKKELSPSPPIAWSNQIQIPQRNCRLLRATVISKSGNPSERTGCAASFPPTRLHLATPTTTPAHLLSQVEKDGVSKGPSP